MQDRYHVQLPSAGSSPEHSGKIQMHTLHSCILEQQVIFSSRPWSISDISPRSTAIRPSTEVDELQVRKPAIRIRRI